MKTKPGFDLRSVCGENILIATGKENMDFNAIISLNETATCVWRNVEGREFTVADMAAVLTDEYDVDQATAQADCEALAEEWIKAGIVEA